MINATSYLLNESGAVAFQQLIPLNAGVSAACTDPCVCDSDGAVGGVCE